MGVSRCKLGRRPAIVLALFVAIALSYTLVIPLGEGYDEWAHFAYIRYLVNEAKIPASGQRLVPEVAWDATHHPPLYYLFGALATSGIDMSDNLRPRTNPYLADGYTLNAYIQGPEHEWPWRGSVLGMRVARGVSLVMGALTVLLTYHIGRRLAPERGEIALAAMAIVALMPQFLFTSSIITNDIGIALFTTLAAFLAVRFVQAPSFKDVGLLILTTLAAMATKANGIALLPAVVMLLGGMVFVRGGSLSRAQRVALVVGAVVLLVGALGFLVVWESWNTYLQGHHSSVFGALTHYILPAILGGAEQRGQILAWDLLPEGLRYTYQTFWAAFGMGNIPADPAFYVAITVINLLALVGIVLCVRRRPGATRQGLAALAVIALWTLVPPVFLILSSHITDVAPGRYLMSLAPIVAIVHALGLAELASSRWERHVLGAYVSALLVFAVAVPWLYIRPAYTYSRRVSLAQVEQLAQPLEFRFGEELALVGYRLPEEAARPGEIVEITLYWQCLAEMAEDYTLSVQLLDPDYVFYGGVSAYPGRGNEATSLWKPGEVIEDRVPVRIGDDFPAPAYAQVKVEVYGPGAEAPLPLVTPRGPIVNGAAIFGRLPVVADDPPLRISHRPAEAVFGEALALVEHSVEGAPEPGAELTLSLRWRALASVAHDYTVLVHLLDQNGEKLAQADGPPLAGRYPTSLWRPGEELLDVHRLTIPADAVAEGYWIAVGLYRPESLERLAAVDADGNLLAHNAYMIRIEVPKTIAR